jgi:hypothetical protein
MEKDLLRKISSVGLSRQKKIYLREVLRDLITKVSPVAPFLSWCTFVLHEK